MGGAGRAREESSESPAANAREGGPRRSPPTPGAHPHPEPPNWSSGPPALPHQRLCAQRRAARQTAREDWEISDVSIEPRTRSSLGFLSSRPSTPVPFHIPASPSLPQKNLFLSRVVRILGPTRLALDTALTDSQREFSFPRAARPPEGLDTHCPQTSPQAQGNPESCLGRGGGGGDGKIRPMEEFLDLKANLTMTKFLLPSGKEAILIWGSGRPLPDKRASPNPCFEGRETEFLSYHTVLISR